MRTTWWRKNSRDVVVLAACSVILLGSGLLEVEDDRVTVDGAPVPSVCWMRSALTQGCPACGLTRSVVALVHFRWVDSFNHHPAGILFGLVVLVQIPYRVVRLVGNHGAGLGKWVPGASRIAMVVVLCVSLAQWTGTLCA